MDGLAPALFALLGLFFNGFGYKVILGDDFKKPAYFDKSRSTTRKGVVLDTPLDQPLLDRSQPSTFAVHRRQRNICGEKSSRHDHSGNLEFCTFYQDIS